MPSSQPHSSAAANFALVARSFVMTALLITVVEGGLRVAGLGDPLFAERIYPWLDETGWTRRITAAHGECAGAPGVKADRPPGDDRIDGSRQQSAIITSEIVPPAAHHP